MRKVLILLIVLLALISLVSMCLAVAEIRARSNDIKQFNELYEMVSATVTETVEPENEAVDFETEHIVEEEPVVQSSSSRNISLLSEMTPDFVGWIYVHDTDINYPVMHTPYEPQKYIRRDFHGKYSVSGVPFIDGECSLYDDNVIIYGHNMTNGTMFANLEEYYSEDFFLSHPVIEFQTDDGTFVYTVFAVLTVKNDDDWYYFFNANDELHFESEVSALKNKALYYSEYEPEYGDKFITLSTCYERYGDNRIVLVGVCEN